MSKICIISTVSITLKTFVLPTALRLAKAGHEVTLVCSDDKELADMLPNDICYCPVHMERGVSASSFMSLLRLYSLFVSKRFDLIQYATPNASLYSSIAGRLARVPVRLYCQWGIRYVCMEGLSRRIFRFFEKITCKYSTDIWAASRGNMQFAISELMYEPEKAFVIGEGGTSGVDLEAYDISMKQIWRQKVRANLSIPENAFVFGYSGRVCADKGCSELISAFRETLRSFGNAYLLLIGPFEESNGDFGELLNWASSCSNVVVTGCVPNLQMKEYYSAMDVLVHPTYREGFGMVIQEAGAMGVPSITTRVLGASEVMVEGMSCRLVDPRDAASLQVAMEEMIANKIMSIEYGNAARERVVRCFSQSTMIEKQIERYSLLLGGVDRRYE